MKTSTFKRVVSLALTVLMCLSLVLSTGVMSVSAATTYELYLRGSFNGWGAESGYKFTNNGDGTYSFAIEMAAGSYTCKAGTSDWGYSVPSQDYAFSLSSSSIVVFTANTNNNTLTHRIDNDGVDYILADAKEKMVLRTAWTNNDQYVLAESNGKVIYVSSEDENYDNTNHYWNIIPANNGFYLQNWATKNYVYSNGTEVLIGEGNTDANRLWKVKTVGEGKKFFDANGNVINIENLTGEAELAKLPSNALSARWIFDFDTYDYTLSADKVTGAGFNAYAKNGNSITSYATGQAQTWNLSTDISKYPTFKAPNSPLAEAVYNLSAEEIVKNTYVDPEVGKVFRTGTAWNKVWTRDTAYANLFSLSWIDPEIAANCALKKVHTDKNTGVAVFEQDTGTGGSYPTSTDKIITLVSVWETYLADGNVETLEYFYDVDGNKQEITLYPSETRWIK